MAMCMIAPAPCENALILRGTFLEVVATRKFTRRCRSLSASRLLVAENDIYSSQKDYMNNLSIVPAMVEPLKSECVVEEKLTATNLNMLKKEGSSARLNADSFFSSSTTASSIPGVLGQRRYNFSDLDSDDEFDDLDAMAEVGSDVSTAATARPQCNKGSAGHPELCLKPCIFIASGRCEAGMDCGYCHFQHDKRPLHFDKRNRVALSELSFRECIESRAQQLGVDASAVFADLVRFSPEALPAQSRKSAARRTQPLVKAMTSLSFLTILTVLLGRPDAPAALHDDAFKNKITDLRYSVPDHFV